MQRYCATCGTGLSAQVGFCGQCGTSTGPIAAPAFPIAPPRRPISTALIGTGVAALFLIVLGLAWALWPRELSPESAREVLAVSAREPITAPLPVEEAVFAANVLVDQQTGAFEPFYQDQVNQTRARLERLRQAGYITFEEEAVSTYMFTTRLGNVVFRLTPTAKLEAEIMSRSPNGRTLDVKVGNLVVDQVLAIEPTGADRRVARYTRKVELNELADLLPSSEIPEVPPPGETTFSRVDGNWIIEVNESGD